MPCLSLEGLSRQAVGIANGGAEKQSHQSRPKLGRALCH